MNTSKLVTLSLLTLAVAQFTGCASMKKNASATQPAPVAEANTPAPAEKTPTAPKAPILDEILIVSDPVGAAVSIDGNSVGITPLSTTLDRARTYTLTVTQPGYVVYTRPLKAESQVAGGQTGRAGFMTFTPKRIPRTLYLTLNPVEDRYAKLALVVGVLDNRLRKEQITPEEYKKELAEVTGKYRQTQ
jgi:uncharacterized protein YceK